MLENGPGLLEAARLCGDDKDAVAQIIRSAEREASLSGDDYSDGFRERTELRIERVQHAMARRIARGTGVLATIGSTAPFVGLFGTVWGIMNSFIGISESKTTSLAVVAPGIAEALLATALGLVAAIPAVVIYNHLARSTSGLSRAARRCGSAGDADDQPRPGPAHDAPVARRGVAVMGSKLGSSLADDDLVEQHEINVTPFIDVMLVLLIIFMVAAPLATVDIGVDLPASSAQMQPRPDKPVFVTVKTDLSVAVGESTTREGKPRRRARRRDQQSQGRADLPARRQDGQLRRPDGDHERAARLRAI